MNEKILKKTIELIVKDVKDRSTPVMNGIKVGFVLLLICVKLIMYGMITSAAIFFFNKKGYEIAKNIDHRLSGTESDSFIITTVVGMITIICLFIYNLIERGLLLVYLLVVTNLVGLMFVLKGYFDKKQQEAVDSLDKKGDIKFKPSKGVNK